MTQLPLCASPSRRPSPCCAHVVWGQVYWLDGCLQEPWACLTCGQAGVFSTQARAVTR